MSDPREVPIVPPKDWTVERLTQWVADFNFKHVRYDVQTKTFWGRYEEKHND